MSQRLAVFTGGLFDDHHAKTAHGVLRYGPREVVAVVDPVHAGKLANQVRPYCERAAPIVPTVAEARRRGAEVLVIGVAPFGGRLTDEWRTVILEAIGLGMAIEAGLHTVLADDPELVAAGAASGVELRDLRQVPEDLAVASGVPERGRARVVHTVGSDCSVGKMSVTLELDRAARRRGLDSAFVPTGQTGIAIAGWGLAIDHVISDFVAGASERLVREGAERAGLLWLEGQGSIYHPAYSGVTLGLLHGSLPDLLILCHEAGQEHIDGYPANALPSLPEMVSGYESAAAWIRPAPVATIALNTRKLDQASAREAIAKAQASTGLPTDDVVRFGPDRLLDAVLARLED